MAIRKYTKAQRAERSELSNRLRRKRFRPHSPKVFELLRKAGRNSSYGPYGIAWEIDSGLRYKNFTPHTLRLTASALTDILKKGHNRPGALKLLSRIHHNLEVKNIKSRRDLGILLDHLKDCNRRRHNGKRINLVRLMDEALKLQNRLGVPLEDVIDCQREILRNPSEHKYSFPTAGHIMGHYDLDLGNAEIEGRQREERRALGLIRRTDPKLASLLKGRRELLSTAPDLWAAIKGLPKKRRTELTTSLHKGIGERRINPAGLKVLLDQIGYHLEEGNFRPEHIGPLIRHLTRRDVMASGVSPEALTRELHWARFYGVPLPYAINKQRQALKKGEGIEWDEIVEHYLNDRGT